MKFAAFAATTIASVAAPQAKVAAATTTASVAARAAPQEKVTAATTIASVEEQVAAPPKNVAVTDSNDDDQLMTIRDHMIEADEDKDGELSRREAFDYALDLASTWGPDVSAYFSAYFNHATVGRFFDFLDADGNGVIDDKDDNRALVGAFERLVAKWVADPTVDLKEEMQNVQNKQIRAQVGEMIEKADQDQYASKDGEISLSLEEAQEFARSKQGPATFQGKKPEQVNKEVELMFPMIDTNQDYLATRREIEVFALSMAEINRKVGAVIDTADNLTPIGDKNGSISKSEAQVFATEFASSPQAGALGFVAGEMNVKDLFMFIDVDEKNGEVTREELFRFAVTVKAMLDQGITKDMIFFKMFAALEEGQQVIV